MGQVIGGSRPLARVRHPCGLRGAGATIPGSARALSRHRKGPPGAQRDGICRALCRQRPGSGLMARRGVPTLPGHDAVLARRAPRPRSTLSRQANGSRVEPPDPALDISRAPKCQAQELGSSGRRSSAARTLRPTSRDPGFADDVRPHFTYLPPYDMNGETLYGLSPFCSGRTHGGWLSALGRGKRARGFWRTLLSWIG